MKTIVTLTAAAIMLLATPAAKAECNPATDAKLQLFIGSINSDLEASRNCSQHLSTLLAAHQCNEAKAKEILGNCASELGNGAPPSAGHPAPIVQDPTKIQSLKFFAKAKTMLDLTDATNAQVKNVEGRKAKIKLGLEELLKDKKANKSTKASIQAAIEVANFDNMVDNLEIAGNRFALTDLQGEADAVYEADNFTRTNIGSVRALREVFRNKFGTLQTLVTDLKSAAKGKLNATHVPTLSKPLEEIETAWQEYVKAMSDIRWNNATGDPVAELYWKQLEKDLGTVPENLSKEASDIVKKVTRLQTDKVTIQSDELMLYAWAALASLPEGEQKRLTQPLTLELGSYEIKPEDGVGHIVTVASGASFKAGTLEQTNGLWELKDVSSGEVLISTKGPLRVWYNPALNPLPPEPPPPPPLAGCKATGVGGPKHLRITKTDDSRTDVVATVLEDGSLDQGTDKVPEIAADAIRVCAEIIVPPPPPPQSIDHFQIGVVGDADVNMKNIDRAKGGVGVGILVEFNYEHEFSNGLVLGTGAKVGYMNVIGGSHPTANADRAKKDSDQFVGALTAKFGLKPFSWLTLRLVGEFYFQPNIGAGAGLEGEFALGKGFSLVAGAAYRYLPTTVPSGRRWGVNTPDLTLSGMGFTFGLRYTF